MCDNTHAMGQMLGYLVQARHMLFDLITLEDITVSVELLDDVAVEQNDAVIVEQLKNVTSGNNPITDHSPVFWKTFFNWFNYLTHNQMDINTTIFKMVVISNRTLNAGSLVNKFHEADTEEKASAALEDAKRNLWGDCEKKRNDIPESYSTYLNTLFDEKNRKLVSQLILKFKLELFSNTYEDELHEKFNHQLIPQEFSEELFRYMLGWVNDIIYISGQKGEPSYIKSSDYRATLTAQIRMYDQDRMIPQLSDNISTHAVQEAVKNKDIYIQQLDLINMDLEEELEAASDFLQTKVEECIRADRGMITTQSITEYEKKLEKLWKASQRIVKLESPLSDEDKGQALYFRMLQQAVSVDTSLPNFFGSGKLQGLANTPHNSPRIGWHPKYKELLKGDDPDEGK